MSAIYFDIDGKDPETKEFRLPPFRTYRVTRRKPGMELESGPDSIQTFDVQAHLCQFAMKDAQVAIFFNVGNIDGVPYQRMVRALNSYIDIEEVDEELTIQ